MTVQIAKGVVLAILHIKWSENRIRQQNIIGDRYIQNQGDEYCHLLALVRSTHIPQTFQAFSVRKNIGSTGKCHDHTSYYRGVSNRVALQENMPSFWSAPRLAIFSVNIHGNLQQQLTIFRENFDWSLRLTFAGVARIAICYSKGISL